MDKLENEVLNISDIVEIVLIKNEVEFSKFEEIIKSDKTKVKGIKHH